TEDDAVVQLELSDGATATLRCSWYAHAGHDAVIGVTIHGSEGGAAWRNVNGSFYDFEAVRLRTTTSERLCGPPDEWGGRAAVSWLHSLAAGAGYDPAIESLADVAAALDAIYGRTGS